MLTLLLFIISIFVALFLALSFRQAVAYSTKLRGLSTMPPSNGRKSVTPAVVRLRPLALMTPANDAQDTAVVVAKYSLDHSGS